MEPNGIEIVLDTESTGLDVNKEKLVEIGCVELFNGIKTGRTFQVYINPEKPIPPDSTRVHHITDEMVKDSPIFAQVVEDFLDFISDKPLIIHNAKFDIGILNAELDRIGKEKIQNKIIDTLLEAKKKFPGSPASLDALMRRFGISKKEREINGHGALLDADLLANVYLELCGGREKLLSLENTNGEKELFFKLQGIKRKNRIPFIVKNNETELTQYLSFVDKFKNKPKLLIQTEENQNNLSI